MINTTIRARGFIFLFIISNNLYRQISKYIDIKILNEQNDERKRFHIS